MAQIAMTCVMSKERMMSTCALESVLRKQELASVRYHLAVHREEIEINLLAAMR